MKDNVIQEFMESIKTDPEKKQQVYSATVSRIDSEGTVWVFVAGSNKETPTASTSASVKSGDEVNVMWQNNKLYIVGNYSDPSSGIAKVRQVEMAANTAREAANNAVADAGRARQAAEEAEATANSVRGIAVEAQTNAGIAKTAADKAMYGLGQVEDVIGVITWIAEHGTYTKATTYVDGTPYYTATGTQVTTPSDKDVDSNGVLIYYELSGGVYTRTTDTSVDTQKIYYMVTGTPVATPKAEDIGQYYTLSISDAMADYVQSHLALTDEGLYVMADGSEWKVLIKSDGVYVVDPQGNYASQFKSFAQLGVTSGSHTVVDSNGQRFYAPDGTTILAEFSAGEVRVGTPNGNRVTITSTSVTIGNDVRQFVFDMSQGMVWQNYSDEQWLVVSRDNFEYRQGTYASGFRILNGRNDHMGMMFGEHGYPTHSDAGVWAELYSVAFGGAFYDGQASINQITEADGQYSFAQGIGAQAHGDYSNAHGLMTEAGYEAQTAVGKYNDNKQANAFEIGNGTADSTRSNAFEVDWNGNVAAAGDITDGSGNTLSAKPNTSAVDAALALKADTASLGGLATKNSVANVFSAPTATSGSPAFTTSTYAAQKNVVVPSPGADYVPIAVVGVTMTGTGTGVIVSRGFDLDGIARGSDATVKTYWMNTAKTNIAANTGTITVQVMFAKVNLS